MKKYIVMFAAMIWIAQVCIGQEESLGAKSPRIAEAVRNYLELEQYWFGRFDGDECYGKLAKHEANVEMYLIKSEGNDSKCGKQEDKSDSESNVVIVHYANSNALYQINGIKEKMRARAIVNDSSGCGKGRLISMAMSDLKKNARDKLVTKILVPTIAPANFTEIDQKDNEIVINAIKRSLIHLRNDGQLNSSNKQKPTTSLMIGRYRTVDPYLIVYSQKDNAIYFLDFPSIDLLKSESICMREITRFDLNRPKGVDEQKYFLELLNKLKKSSFNIRIDEGK